MSRAWIERHGAWLAAAAGMAGALVLELPGLLDPFRIHPDVFQILPGILAAPAGSPLHGDLLASFGARLLPPGYEALYRTAAAGMDPVLFSRLLSFLLIPLSAFLVHRVARRFLDPLPALAATVLFLLLPPHLTRFQGGLPRAFAYPALLLFAEGVFGGSAAAMVTGMGLGALFYPPAFIFSAFSFPLLAFAARREIGPRFRTLACAWALSLFTAGAVLAWTYFGSGDAEPLLSRAEAFAMAEYGRGGRLGFVSHYDVAGFLGRKISTFEFAAAGLLLMLGGTAGLRLDRRLLALPVAGWTGMTIAWFAFPWFYLPHRYLSMSLDLFMPLAVAVLLARVLAVRAGREQASRLPIPVRHVTTFAFGMAGAALVLPGFRHLALPLSEPGAFAGFVSLLALGVVLLPGTGNGPRHRSPGAWSLLLAAALAWNAHSLIARADVSVPARILEGVRALPDAAVIAGSPRAVDSVPVYAHRRIYAGYETAIPLHDRYYKTVRARLDDLFAAYYATSIGEVRTFCGRTGVSAIIVDLDDYRPERLARGTGLGEPFDSKWRASLDPKRNFALPDAARRHATASEGSLRLVRCADL